MIESQSEMWETKENGQPTKSRQLHVAELNSDYHLVSHSFVLCK